eukprot:1180961-Prorocentrum_minimum.AAC.3
MHPRGVSSHWNRLATCPALMGLASRLLALHRNRGITLQKPACAVSCCSHRDSTEIWGAERTLAVIGTGGPVK